MLDKRAALIDSEQNNDELGTSVIENLVISLNKGLCVIECCSPKDDGYLSREI